MKKSQAPYHVLKSDQGVANIYNSKESAYKDLDKISKKFPNRKFRVESHG